MPAKIKAVIDAMLIILSIFPSATVAIAVPIKIDIADVGPIANCLLEPKIAYMIPPII